MKRKLFFCGFIFLFISFSAASFEKGPVISAGLNTSIIKPYIYETAAFKLQWNTGLGMDIGVRAFENILRKDLEPVFYFSPLLNFNYKYFYIGGGPLFCNEIQSISFVIRTGVNTYNLWKWGPGFGGFDCGLELSPMIAFARDSSDDAKQNAENALGGLFLTIFNSIKLNLGITWYLPF